MASLIPKAPLKPLLLGLLPILLFTSCQENEGLHLRKKIIKQIYPSIVEVIIPKREDSNIVYERPLPFDQQDYKQRNDKYYAIGTAFFISPTRLISAAHVIPASEYSTWTDYKIRTQSGEVFPIHKIYRYSSYRDVIEFDLKTYPKNIHSLKLREKVEIGDMVYAVGNAQGQGISTRGGQVSTFTPEPFQGAWNYIRFSSPASPGNSGGPLVNSKGEVVGVIVMKNQSENLNFALPIGEVKKISTKEAYFLERKLKVQDGNQVLVRDWQYKSPLPSTLKDLRKAAIPNLDKFYENLIHDFKKKFHSLIFPYNPRYRESLLRQPPTSKLSIVEKDQALVQWNIVPLPFKKITVDENNILYYAKGSVFQSYALFKLAPNETPASLLKNPRTLLKRYLMAFGANREMAGQRIAIKDPGPPRESFFWKDQLGRTWYTSRWEFLYNNSLISNHCTPSPEGVYCFMDHDGTSRKYGGYMHFTKENIIELLLSYSGTVDQWIQFLNMDKELIPKFLTSFSLRKKKGNLEVTSPEWKLKISLKNFNDKTSSITTSIGYNPEKELEAKMTWFHIILNKYSDFKLSLVKNYQSQKLSPDASIEHWNKVSSKQGVFDGKTHIIGNRQQVNFQIGPERKDIILAKERGQAKERKEIKSQWLLRCQAQNSFPKKKFISPCLQLKKNIVLN